MLNMVNTVRFLLVLLSSTLLLLGCSNDKPMQIEGDITSALLGEGYRYQSDVCHLVGENEMTNQFLDDSHDLVGCPDDITLIGNIEGAEHVMTIGSYRLFTVPTIIPVE